MVLVNVLSQFVCCIELVVTLRTGVVMQRDVLGDTGGGLKLSVAVGAGVSHCITN